MGPCADDAGAPACAEGGGDDGSEEAGDDGGGEGGGEDGSGRAGDCGGDSMAIAPACGEAARTPAAVDPCAATRSAATIPRIAHLPDVVV